MKDIKYLSWILLFFLFGCVDDDSKYGGNEIDEITIEGIEDYNEIEFGSNLVVTPTVKTKFGEQSDLSYVWYKYDKKQLKADTLSFEKDLDVLIMDVLPGEEVTLSFKVTDNRTGVYQLHNSIFKTIGVYAGGTLMLCQNDGQYDLSMLKKDGITFYENLYSFANQGEKLGEQAKRLFLTHAYARNPSAYRAVIVACDNQTGGVYLDADALVRKAYMREKFMFPEDLPENLMISGISNGQSEEYLIVNGGVYGRTMSTDGEDRWEPAYLVLSEPADYEMSSFVAQPFSNDMWGSPYYGKPIFYDNRHGRFMVNSSGGYLSYLGGDLSDFSKFDPSDMGEGLHLVATGCVNNDLNEVWALLKDIQSIEYTLITYQIVVDENYRNGFVSVSKQVIAQNHCPGMYAAEVFVPGNKYAISTSDMWNQKVKGLSNVLFYLSDNKVYAFNTQSNSEGVLIDGAKEGYIITGIDCTEVAWPTAENQEATITQLTLSVKDQTLSGKQGGIAVYKLNSVSGLSAQKLYAKTGFCDEVIATVEKQD